MIFHLREYSYPSDSPASDTALTTISAGSNYVCLRCSTNKAGKRSCCARGGAWFKNCGDVGDKKFDHTWAEGIQACNDVVNVAKSQEQVKLAHAGANVHDRSAKPSQSPNDIHWENISRGESIFHDDDTDTGSRSVLVKILACVNVLFVI